MLRTMFQKNLPAPSAPQQMQPAAQSLSITHEAKPDANLQNAPSHPLQQALLLQQPTQIHGPIDSKAALLA